MNRNVQKTYKKVTQVEHVLLRPDTYIGSVTATDQQMWVLDQGAFVFQKIKYIPGLYKIFDQILVNASDNYQRDKKMTMIRVQFKKDQITILNDGKSIPVQMHKVHKVLVPQLIFGHLLTSSNYEDQQKKTTGGRNGYGAKLTNILCQKFNVEIADSVNKKLLKITWSNNMSQMSQPVVQDFQGKSYTKISFTPDYKRFGITKIPADMLSLMKRRVYDIAGIISTSVYLDNKLVQIANFKQYVNYHLDQENQIIAELQKSRSGRWQVIICRSEGQFMQVSFVNGIYTSKGGTHITYILDQIVDKIIATLAKKKHTGIKPFQVKAQLKLFVNCLIDNPSFDSQIKENLTTHPSEFGSSCEISDQIIKKILNSGIVQKLIHQMKLKQHNKIDKELRKIKKNRLIIPKLDDANEAGRSKECCLILTEGDSAKTLALCGIEELGRDLYGVYPLKGKLLNVKQLTPKSLMQNIQLSNIVKIMGLSFEKDYTSTESLRYSSVMIMADQDNDGSHIKGLVINFFETFWPSLCKIKGFLRQFITPIVKCKKGNNSMSFYSQVEYKRWEQINQGGWAIKYYKGLGTSTSKQAKEYFRDLQKHQLIFDYKDNEDKESLDLAFSKKNANMRKTWLSTYNPQISLDYSIKSIKITDFVHKELIHYSISDNIRSIPSVMDGLKPSQRKVLFACFKRNLVNEIKVAQLAGYVAQHSAYHHGEMSLCSTIIGMAQNFIGSNNLNLLEPIGQFGTRYQNGKDSASARYIFTKLNKLTRLLFNEADDHVVQYIFEQNQMIQPKYYAPILPLILINGCEGIGTGWSTTVHSHKVQDVIQAVRKRIAGQFWDISIGWQNFKGLIQKGDNKSFTIKGLYYRDNDTLTIRQIPPNKSIKDYKQFLEQLLASAENQDPSLEDVKEYHQDGNIEFVIRFIEGKQPPEQQLQKYLKLSTAYHENNMHLFTAQGKIKKYQSIQEILEDFYEERSLLYQKRRKYLLSKFQKQHSIINNQIRFIEAIIDGQFRMIQKKEEWIHRLKSNHYNTYQQVNKIYSTKIRQDEEQNRHKDYNYLLQMPIWSFCQEKIQQLQKTKRQLSSIVEYYQLTSIQQLWLKDIAQFEQAWNELNPHHISKESIRRTENKQPSRQRRNRQPVQIEEEIPLPKNRNRKKNNLMQEELQKQLIRPARKQKEETMIEKPIKQDDEENQDNNGSNIDSLLSKYLGKNNSKNGEEMSLQMRIRARMLNGDDTFNVSYKAAIEEMQKQQPKYELDEDWLQ